MKLETLDIEEWSALNFAEFVRVKLLDHGIEYTVKRPMDLIIMGQLIKTYGREYKTKYALKCRIDEIMHNLQINQVASLQFLATLIKPQFKEKPHKMKLLKDDTVQISDSLRKRLLALK